MSRIAIVFISVFSLLFTGGNIAASAATAGSDCPESSNGPGPLRENLTVKVFAGGYTTIDNILNKASSKTTSVVCGGGSSYGYTYAENNMVSYGHYGEGTSTDTFTVGATDGDKYYSTMVTVKVAKVVVSDPVLTKKLKLKNGKVTKKATVQFTNDSGYPLEVAYDHGTDMMGPDGVKQVANGESITIKTPGRKLSIFISMTEAGNYASVMGGTMNTRKGTFTVEYEPGS